MHSIFFYCWKDVHHIVDGQAAHRKVHWLKSTLRELLNAYISAAWWDKTMSSGPESPVWKRLCSCWLSCLIHTTNHAYVLLLADLLKHKVIDSKRGLCSLHLVGCSSLSCTKQATCYSTFTQALTLYCCDQKIKHYIECAMTLDSLRNKPSAWSYIESHSTWPQG